MNAPRLRIVPLLAVFALFLPAPSVASTPVRNYPQIVRLSLVQGDVRIMRNEGTESIDDAAWETAEANIPLETGFILSTGDGYAEVEFEDNSTAYLGQTSVLVFNDLTVSNSIPNTVMTLASGTITLNLHPIEQESFLLRTATDGLSVRYPQNCLMRIGSYQDAMTTTPLVGMKLRVPGTNLVTTTKGETTTFQNGAAVPNNGAIQYPNYDDWDAWVSTRVQTRQAAVNEALAASGLTTAIPGIVELNSEGTFFPCAPHGTCWQPKETASSQSATAAGGAVAGGAANSAAGASPLVAAQATPQQKRTAPQVDEWLSTPFPCSPFDVSTRVLKNPYSGKATLVDSQLVPRGSPYDWARCHAGSWIYRNKGYVWVAGPHRHHLPPCHWVKSGHTVGFVPIHPGDAKGAPPKNVKHGIIVPAKGDDPRERVEFKPAKRVKALNAAPKQFREVAFPTLARAGTPTMVTHSIAGFSASAKNGAEHGVETPLTPRSTAGLESHTVEVGRGGVIPGSSFAGNRGGTSSASGHASLSGSGGAGGHASSGGSSGGGRSSGGGGGGASGGGHSSGGGGGGGGSGGGGGGHPH